MKSSKRNFIVLSENATLLVQAMVAIHAFADARCIAVCPRGTRRLRLSNMTCGIIYADFHGGEDHYLIAELNRLADMAPDTMIVPNDCASERLVDRIRPHLKAATIPAPDAAMLDCFDDKWQFYQFCRRHGLLVPASRWIGSKRNLDFAAVAHELGLSFVIKPVNEALSAGVCVISSEQECRNEILDNAQYQFEPLIAQQYIRGTDVGLNLLAIHGRITAIAVQRRDFPQRFRDPIEFIDNPELEHAAHRLCEMSAYHGVMNIDACVEDGTGKVFLLESNPRFWGSLLASVWGGLNFVQACVEPPLPPGQMRRLNSGRADMYRHPIVRPRLWGHALFSPHAYRRRMVRRMLCDLWTFLLQLNALKQKIRQRLRRHLSFS